MDCIAYDLIVRSDIELPELQAVPASRAHEPVAVTVTTCPVDQESWRVGASGDSWWWTHGRDFCIWVPEVARFLVRDGREIQVEPEPNADPASVRVFLLGSVFGALLFQRNYLVIHGNAVQIGDQCLICVGDSGAGKSTLAAALMQRGFPVLTDDVVPVDAQCRALPGFPRIKLWQETADRFQIDTSLLTRIMPDMEKFNLPVAGQFAERPLPVRWVYVLNKHDREDIVLEPVQGMQRFSCLLENTYRPMFMGGMGLNASHLGLCAELSSRIRLVKVTRPAQGFALDQLMDRILQDVSENA